MEEIAASMDAAGLPTGFHEAAADVYDRAADSAAGGRQGNAGGPAGGGQANAGRPGTLDAVLSALM
jgi:hypothetical protein